MRIIAGELGGRRIEAPPGRGTRPMLDRVREALFSILADELPGARVLDLFAGSGSLALEAVSRGAERARAVERDPRALAVLRRNVEALGVSDRVEVARADALEPSAWRWSDAGGGRAPAVAFCDPPYPIVREPGGRARLFAALETLLEDALAPGGTCVLHAPRGALYPAHLPGRAEERGYGTSALWFLRRTADAGAAAGGADA